MAGTFSDESGVGSSSDGTSNAQQRCRASEEFAEWRSSEQVVNGTTSTSPLWDADDYDDCGPKPSELYGNFEWDIQNFSGIKKKELRSGVFKAGGYKWYVLIYPQGCDVCNHLSLFLCVANHDDLLPGWSHFAQFTILVTNKDPKKNKYSDTLHRFWKKEHDWGWKKFMEISKLVDGFTENDTLKIKAQVQIIRDRVDRPFRCLTTLYRRELVRIYLSHVDKMCCRFLEKIRIKVGGLIDDAPRWSSFCTYWREIDQKTRHNLARCKKDSQMFKGAIEELFKDKEVTSTLVMDSLYSGIKSLEGEIKNNRVKSNFFDDQTPMPIVLEKETFVLVEDVVILLEKAAVETLPPNDASCEEDIITERTIERYEKRLIEIGRKTIELIITDYIFKNKIELAFQETVALKNQEELLREEEQEAAWLAAGDRKAKRGAVGKETKSKKKTGKQKKSNRKGKDRIREVKPSEEEKRRQENRTSERKEFMSEVAEAEMIDLSDMSDSGECGIEDKEYGPNNWDNDTSEIHHPLVEITANGGGWKKSSSLRDDSSSTCSTDSVRSVVINVPNKVNSVSNKKPHKTPVRAWSRRVESSHDIKIQTQKQTSDDIHIQRQTLKCMPANSQVAESKTQDVLISLQDRVKRLEQHMVNKEEISTERKLPIEDEVNTKSPLKKNPTDLPSPKKLPSVTHQKPDLKTSSEPTSPLRMKKPDSVININQPTNKPTTESAPTPKPIPIPKTTPQQALPHVQTTPRPPALQAPPPVQSTPRLPVQQVPPPVQSTRRLPVQQVPPPVPLEKLQIPTSTQVAADVSAVHSAPSSSTRLGPDPNQSSTSLVGFDPSPSTHHYSGPKSAYSTAQFVHAPTPSIYNNPQSYRNAMMTGNSVNIQLPYSQPLSGFFLSGSESSVRRGLTYENVNNDQNIDMYMHAQQNNKPQDPYADDFPHIDIINELLDDGFQSHNNMTSPYDAGPAGPSSGMWSYSQDNNRVYLNGRIPEQLQINGSDLPYRRLMRNSEGAGYPYHVPAAAAAAAAGYLNLPYGVDGYSVYRP